MFLIHNVFDFQLHVLSDSLLFGVRSQAWMFSEAGTACIEGIGAQAILCLFLNLLSVDRSQWKLLCATLAGWRYW